MNNMKNHFTLLFLLCALLAISCSKDKTADPPVIAEDCKYQFPENQDDIYGAWETGAVVNLTTGDTTFYAPGTSHGGFIFWDLYADAFELRNNGEFTDYYVFAERLCSTNVDGTWSQNQDTLVFDYAGYRQVYIPILSLTATELVIQDTVNFVPSIAIMRKWAE
ncbi:MAG: hypothetical protein DHS20C18_04440 [Saprospiraceae bacterium]|nr:MAG: hypothetical protein DHS20C18_04440 [Saprospiraceae bacterium]